MQFRLLRLRFPLKLAYAQPAFGLRVSVTGEKTMKNLEGWNGDCHARVWDYDDEYYDDYDPWSDPGDGWGDYSDDEDGWGDYF